MKSSREMISRSQPHDTSGRALPLGNKFRESFKLTKESFPDDHTQGGEEGGNRNPNRDVAEGVVVVGGLSHFHAVRFDIDDVVLLEVIDGRVENVLAAEIYEISFGGIAFLTEHANHVAATIDGEVSRHADGFKDGEVVAFDFNATGFGDFTQDVDVLIVGSHGDHGIVDEAVAEDFLNLGGSLCAGESADLHASHAEEVDVSVFVDGVALVVGVLSAATSGSLGEVVAHRQLRCGGTGDGDADFVAGGEAQCFQRLCLNRLSGVEVLEIENFLSRVARSQTYSCKQEYDELFFHCL